LVGAPPSSNKHWSDDEISFLIITRGQMPKGVGHLCLRGLCPCRHDATRRLCVSKEGLLRDSLKVLGLPTGYYRDDLDPLVMMLRAVCASKLLIPIVRQNG